MNCKHLLIGFVLVATTVTIWMILGASDEANARLTSDAPLENSVATSRSDVKGLATQLQPSGGSPSSEPEVGAASNVVDLENITKLIAAWDRAVLAADGQLASSIAEQIVAFGRPGVREFAKYIRDLAGGSILAIEPKRDRLALALTVLQVMDPESVVSEIVFFLDTIRPHGSVWLFGSKEYYQDRVEGESFSVHESAGVIPAEMSLLHSALWVVKKSDSISTVDFLSHLIDTQSSDDLSEVGAFREPWLSRLIETLVKEGEVAEEIKSLLFRLVERRTERLQFQFRYSIGATTDIEKLLEFVLFERDLQIANRAMWEFVRKGDNWKLLPDIMDALLLAKGYDRARDFAQLFADGSLLVRGDGKEGERFALLLSRLDHMERGGLQHSLFVTMLGRLVKDVALQRFGNKLTSQSDVAGDEVARLANLPGYSTQLDFVAHVSGNWANSDVPAPWGESQALMLVESSTSLADGARRVLAWLSQASANEREEALAGAFFLPLLVAYNKKDIYLEYPEKSHAKGLLEYMLPFYSEDSKIRFNPLHLIDCMDATYRLVVGLGLSLSPAQKSYVLAGLDRVEKELQSGHLARMAESLARTRANQMSRLAKFREHVAE